MCVCRSTFMPSFYRASQEETTGVLRPDASALTPEGSPLSGDELLQRGDGTRHRRLGVFLRLVLQGDVAAVVRLAQDVDQLLEVGVLGRLAGPLDLRLQL